MSNPSFPICAKLLRSVAGASRPARLAVAAGLLACSLPALAGPSLAALNGLFHSPTDEQRLATALRTRPAPPPKVLLPPPQQDVRLDAIVYVGADNWVVWINGRPVRRGDQLPYAQIVDVAPAAVRLALPVGDGLVQPPPEVVLRPLQSWTARNGQVVDPVQPGARRDL